jgi:hypothetical protein
VKASRLQSSCREAGAPSSGCNWFSWEGNRRRYLPSGLHRRHRRWAGARGELSVWLKTATCCRCRGPCRSRCSSGPRWPPGSRWFPHPDRCTSATRGILSNSRLIPSFCDSLFRGFKLWRCQHYCKARTLCVLEPLLTSQLHISLAPLSEESNLSHWSQFFAHCHKTAIKLYRPVGPTLVWLTASLREASVVSGRTLPFVPLVLGFEVFTQKQFCRDWEQLHHFDPPGFCPRHTHKTAVTRDHCNKNEHTW